MKSGFSVKISENIVLKWRKVATFNLCLKTHAFTICFNDNKKTFFKKNLYRTFFLKIPVLTSFVSSRCCWYLYVYTVAEERQLTIPWVAFLWHLFTDFSRCWNFLSELNSFRHNASKLHSLAPPFVHLKTIRQFVE